MSNWIIPAPLLKAGASAALAWLAAGASLIGLPEIPLAPSAPGQAEAARAQDEPAQTPEAAAAATSDAPARPRFIFDASARIQDHTGDVLFAGQSASIAGEVGHNALIFAQGSSVDGVVRGDFFSWAGSVTISGEIMGDAYVGTGSLIMLEDAVIHGNLLCFCGSMRMDGTIAGDLLGSVGTGSIDGSVDDVEIETGSLAIGPGATIRGNLIYESNDDVDLAEGATVLGQVRRQEIEEDEDDDDPAAAATEESRFSLWGFAWKAWSFASSFIIGAVLLLAGGRGARRPAECLLRQPAPGLGFGFVVAVVFPVACILAFVPIVTLPLGLFGLVVFGLMLFLARLVAAQFLGTWILNRLGQSRASSYAALAVGLVILMLVALIPYLGFLVRLAAILLGVGGIYLALREAGFPAMTAAGSDADVYTPTAGAA